MMRTAGDEVISRSLSHFAHTTTRSIVDYSDAENKRWYAIRCKSRQEHIALTNIDRAGITTFLPQITESKNIKQKAVWSRGPLFPGYLFAKFDAAADYRIVKYARGVHGIVSFGVNPAEVDEELILAIQSRLKGGLAEAHSRITRGQLVRIEGGPLHGMEAVFEKRIPPHQRAVFLLRAISFRARLVMDLEDVVNL